MHNRRFHVIATPENRYQVLDTQTDKFVRYGYNRPPLLEEPGKPRSEWGNFYAATGFADSLDEKNH